MTPAAETTRGAVDARMRSLRLGMARAGRIGRDRATRAAAATEQALTERGMAPQRLAQALAENAGVAGEELAKTTRRARKRMAGNAKRTRQDLARIAKQARKARAVAERKAAKAANSAGRRRRWPWLLGAGAIGLAITYAVRARQAAAQRSTRSTAFTADAENAGDDTNGVDRAADQRSDDQTPQPRQAVRDDSMTHRQ
ncbi:MAG TPA: hypothetical protein VG317_15290 [Pseudonocardiaceae bacterium]|nr:hypothetical protein [Pseudonocardiaceae bacterium]